MFALVRDMTFPVQVTFRGSDPSEAISSLIEKRAEKLGQIFPRITRCKTVVDLHHHPDRTTDRCSVTLTVHIPGEELVVHEPHGKRDTNVYKLVNDAFNHAERALQSHQDKHRPTHHRERHPG